MPSLPNSYNSFNQSVVSAAGQKAATRKKSSEVRDKHKGSRHERGYDGDWERVRNAYINTHTLCEICEQEDRVTPAEDVDHKIPFRGLNDPLRLLWSNLQSICRPHHTQKSAQDRQAGFRRVIVSGYFFARQAAFIRQNATENALVFDMDELGKSLGFPKFPRPNDVDDLLIIWRKQLITRIKSGFMGRDVWIMIADTTTAEAVTADLNGRLVLFPKEGNPDKPIIE